MTPLLFSFKRLSLLAGRGARALASLVWLTPQRCDLLLRLYEEPLIQRDLAFELGVVKSVVSRMVTALEDIGLVKRKNVENDRRLRLVCLTDHAISIIETLRDHYVADELGHTVQLGSEDHVLGRFEDSLRAKSVGISDVSHDDHRELLADMRFDVDTCTLEDWIGYELDLTPEEAVPPWHREGFDPDARFAFSGPAAEAAARHRRAGIPRPKRPRAAPNGTVRNARRAGAIPTSRDATPDANGRPPHASDCH